MRALIVALALAACASPQGEGTTTDWSRNSFVDAAQLSEGRWLVTCTNAASACTHRAAQLCATGFDVVDTQMSQGAAGAASQYGGGYGTQQRYAMTVQCR